MENNNNISPKRELFYCKLCGLYGKCSSGINSNGVIHFKDEHEEKIIKKQPFTRQEIITNAIMYIIFTNSPFRHYNSLYFRGISSENLPSVKWPELIREISNKIDEITITKLTNCEFISLTMDEWTDSSNRRFLAIVAHYCDTDGNSLHSLLCHKHLLDRYTSKNIKNFLLKVAKDYSIEEKIVMIATDTTGNVKGAIRLLNRPWMPCLLHLLNLITKKSCESIQDFDKVQLLARHLSKATLFKEHIEKEKAKLSKEQLQNITRSTTVHMFNTNWWISLYTMIIDIVNLKQFIESYFISEEIP